MNHTNVTMNKLFFLYIFFMAVILWSVPQANAATIAEASIGNNGHTIGTYDLSGMTEEEKKWFVTFLEGNFFTDGWKQISFDILTNTAVEMRDKQQARLHELGFKIGREWCKVNDRRKIHTDNLRKWGKELKNAAEETPQLLTEVIQRIDTEVDKLLN